MKIDLLSSGSTRY